MSSLLEISPIYRKQEYQKHQKRLDSIQNTPRNKLPQIHPQKNKSVSHIQNFGMGTKQKYQLKQDNRAMGKRLFQIATGSHLKNHNSFFNNDYIAKKEQQKKQNKKLSKLQRNVQSTGQIDRNRFFHSFNKGYEIEQENKKLAKRLMKVKSEFQKLPKVPLRKVSMPIAQRQQQNYSSYQYTQSPKSELLDQFSHNEIKTQADQNYSTRLTTLDNVQEYQSFQESQKVYKKEKKKQESKFNKYIHQAQKVNKQNIKNAYHLDRMSKKQLNQEFMKEIIYQEQQDDIINYMLDDMEQNLEEYKDFPIEIQISFTNLLLNSVIPENDEQELYYFKVTVGENQPIDTNPIQFLDFEKESIELKIKFGEIMKKRKILLQVFQKIIKDNKPKYNNLGDFSINMQEYYKFSGQHDMVVDIRNSEQLKKQPNYIPKDQRIKGQASFQLKIKSNIGESQKQKQ